MNDISIIIPALNEAELLPRTLAQLHGENVREIIVVDGGSVDETRAIASSHGARVFTSAPGRAIQMNRGARAATGTILMFLHADTLVPAGCAECIIEVMHDKHVAAGAFRLAIDDANISQRFIAWCANQRSRRLHMPYGDQGIFLRAATFHAIGGFPDIPIMEDFALMRSLRRLGRIAIAPSHVQTSARRWERNGTWRLTLLNQLCVAGYLCGVSPERMARWRDRRRPAPRSREVDGLSSTTVEKRGLDGTDISCR